MASVKRKSSLLHGILTVIRCAENVSEGLSVMIVCVKDSSQMHLLVNKCFVHQLLFTIKCIVDFLG